LRKTGSKNAHGCSQNAENSFSSEFLEYYSKDGDEFLHHIIRVAGNKIWVLFVNVETKEQSKKWVHTNSPNTAEKFKQTSARKLLGTEKELMVEFTQKRTTITPEVFYETLKNCIRPFRTKGMEC
jgi:hypothetical protein